MSTDGPAVTMTGAPGELTLFMSGRKEAAEVTLDGPAPAVAIVQGAASASEPRVYAGRIPSQ